MNYRHHFHAGNFADLLKHSVLLDLLESATKVGTPPLDVIETHAGAGVYALDGAELRGGSEARAGIGRLLAASGALPAGLQRLATRVSDFNGRGPVVRYPGSPLLALGVLRAGDRYVGCELRPDDGATLAASLRREFARTRAEVQVFCADGYTQVEAMPPARRRIVLVDPPYERGDEAQRIVRLVDRLARSSPDAVIAVWAPLKDLESLDRLRAGVEASAQTPGWIVETRLRSLRDPLTMNGCAMIVLGAPETAPQALSAASWIADHLGAAEAVARLQALSPGARNLRVDQGFVRAGDERQIDVQQARKASPAGRRR